MQPNSQIPLMTRFSGDRLKETLAKVSLQVADHLSQMGLSQEVVERLKECLVINTNGGNCLRGRTVLDTGWILSGQDLSPCQIEDLLTLGCLIEFFNAAYLVWDDIMDNSCTRRGRPCWYRRQNVGLMAINDACILKSSIFIILKERFRDHPAYVELLEIFNEAALRTELGQNYDLMASMKLMALDHFTRDTYQFITAHKTGYYTFYVPLALAFLYLRLGTPAKLESVQQVSMLLGVVFQARDDYLDVYGNEQITGKIGTDIQENKCSWLSVEAIRRCDKEQMKALENSYGSHHSNDIFKVRELFEQLKLVQAFEDWDRQMLNNINEEIEKAVVETGLQREIFSEFLSKYFQDPRRCLPGPAV
ncbi:isoprenoid synthase domain-containing protein [Aspergillus bertholletiae]|uniref:Isoprenoid synthase domain-containing protein n=1 Tax=Aspergillus bertholletiae TaxID=1226010 RepID=A0A5N7BJ59_9EURO|nr:isoprenoid synthase domain-containing protein [Aspergillus bertholletiae]